MSLWLHRRAIARAVAGDLDEPAERRLRAHLRGCDACRAHYDELGRVAEALVAERAGASASAVARERARLVAALPRMEDARGEGGLDRSAGPAGVDRSMGAGPRRRPVWIAALLVPAAAALWMVVRPARQPGPSGASPDASAVVWRGGPPAEEAGPPAALLVFASRKDARAGRDGRDKVDERGDTRGGKRGAPPAPSAKEIAPAMHVRLVADLPASGEGRVSQGDFVQFVLRGLQTKAFVTVIGIDDAGELHTYVPRAGSEAAGHEPSASSIPLGSSIDLGAGHRPGRLRLYALLPPAPLDAARIRAAAGRLDLTQPGAPPLDLPIPQVAGVLTIGP